MSKPTGVDMIRPPQDAPRLIDRWPSSEVGKGGSRPHAILETASDGASSRDQVASGEREVSSALDLVLRLPLVPEPRWDIYPEEDSPTFFLPGVSDTDVLASLVPALVALGSDEVRVGRPAERLEKGEWIVRLCWELRNKPGMASIWQDVRVSKEMGGIGIAVSSKRTYRDPSTKWTGFGFVLIGLSFVGFFWGVIFLLNAVQSMLISWGSLSVVGVIIGVVLLLVCLVCFWVGCYWLGVRAPMSVKACRLEEIPQRAAIMRDSVVACIEQVFRELRIPEGMIKRSGKTQ